MILLLCIRIHNEITQTQQPARDQPTNSIAPYYLLTRPRKYQQNEHSSSSLFYYCIYYLFNPTLRKSPLLSKRYARLLYILYDKLRQAILESLQIYLGNTERKKYCVAS